MGRHHKRGVGRREYVGTHRQECDFHQCRQPIGQIRQCPHCHKHFCEHHFTPKPPSVISISNASHEDIQNWRREDAHPCSAYVGYYQRMKDQELNAAKASMDRMRGKGEPTTSNPYQYKPHFARLKHRVGTFGEHSMTCASILAKLYDLNSNQSYALSQFFYTVSYETKLKRESPEKHNEKLNEMYGRIVTAFNSENNLKVFLYQASNESQVIIMQIEGEASEIAHELMDGMDILADRANEKMAFVFNGANFYNYRNIVPKEFREYYDKEKTIFYAYNKIGASDVLVGTLPKDFVSYYSQPNYYNAPKNFPKPKTSAWKMLFWALVIGLITVGAIALFTHPEDIRGMIFPKNCTATLKSGDCSSPKPFYCDNGKIVRRSDICGCPSGWRTNGTDCAYAFPCNEGTLSPDCSIQNKSYQCLNGTLIQNATLCGCPDDYKLQNDICIKIQRCDDKTIYGECSSNTPKYCDNGTLVDRASVCGCAGDLIPQGNRCVSKYETDPKTASYPYVLRGSRASIPVTVYGGLAQYQASQPRTFVCYGGVCPSSSEMQLSFVNEPNEQPYISNLADEIKIITPIQDDQARIAVSLVQNIPYDWAAFNSNSVKGRYPYETLYDNTGVCEEKSVLLASLLRDLGFGTALLRFDVENHMTVGIKCPDQYAYMGTGYCFIEPTAPNIITYSSGDYVGVGKLSSQPVVIPVSDGASFSSVQEEYNDATRYSQIMSMGPVLDMGTYNDWLTLSNKYGMPTNPSSSGSTGTQTTSNPSNNNGVVQSPGTNGACGHAGEACCTMMVSGENSATLYEICEQGLKCTNHQCA